MMDPNIAAFLSFSPLYRWEMKETDGGTEIRFIDLRYRNKGHYPFVAVVYLDRNLNILHSYTGWIFSKKRMRRKVGLLPD